MNTAEPTQEKLDGYLSCRITDSLKKRVLDWCKTNRRDKAFLVRDALEMFLAGQEPKPRGRK